MSSPHILAIPFPAQGHVIPLMELALHLAKHGIKTTFVNTEFNHKRVLKALNSETTNQEMINLVSIPDGMEPWEDRNDLGKLCETITKNIPGSLEELIENIKASGEASDDNISCVLADEGMGIALKVAEKMGIRRAAFWTAPAAALALQLSLPKLIEDGIIDIDGSLIKKQMVQLSPTMPLMNSEKFLWTSLGNQETQRITFNYWTKCNETVNLAEWLLCNSAYDLEPATFSLFQNFTPIGPLLASNRLGKSTGSFWPEDTECLSWLDKQPERSVIYIAFGSFTVFDQVQFQELALGLEHTNMPFLWVVRPDITDDAGKAYPEGFQERIQNRGRLVGWAPQQLVLEHPSIGCFVSHCGWNSTVEGVSNGVPFLCWPYFADQFNNQSYICDEWKIGLELKRDEIGIIRKDEIKNKVEQLLSNECFKTNVKNLQEKVVEAVSKGGCSNNNLSSFIDWIKQDGETSTYARNH